MEEAERLEYEKRKKAEELEAQRRAEEERIRREIEEKIAEEQCPTARNRDGQTAEGAGGEAQLQQGTPLGGKHLFLTPKTWHEHSRGPTLNSWSISA